VQNVFLPFDMNGVTRVVAALSAHNDIGLFSQNIDDFAFAFVAPLRAH
jgi:hypothetical protein